MNRTFATLALAATLPAFVHAQAIDWSRAKFVDYHVVGVYEAETSLIADEHFTATALVEGLGGDMHLSSERLQPESQVMAACTGRKTVKGANHAKMEQLPVPSPVLFGMTFAGGPDLAISVDRKSFVRKKAGWTWTYTPSVQK